VTSLLPIEGTTKCSRIAHGFGFGSGSGFAAEVNPRVGFGFRVNDGFRSRSEDVSASIHRGRHCDNCPKKESARDSIESRTLVRTALPRKLLTPTLRSDLHLRNAPFVMPLLLPLCLLGMPNIASNCY
jgi:hypothetical protein